MADTSDGASTPEDQVRALYGRTEAELAAALEDAIGKPSFGRLLALGAENMAALTRIWMDMADLVLRNLRIAGRSDMTRLARQLHRTEDKLERVLQEVEKLRDEAARERTDEELQDEGTRRRTEDEVR